MKSHHYGDARERGVNYPHGDARARGDEDLPQHDESPVNFWEDFYAGDGAAGAVWSGRVNHALASIVAGWQPGRSLDLGSGEGGDVMWLAGHGWDATGIDLSETAVARARAVAEERGVTGAHFIAADLGEWAESPATIDGAADPFDLVSASFFQSPVALQRSQILRAAAARVRPGGHLVVISHAVPPGGGSDHPIQFVTVESELEALDLDEAVWEILVAEVRSRDAVGTEFAHRSEGERPHDHCDGGGGAGHDHGDHPLDDAVIVARKRA